MTRKIFSREAASSTKAEWITWATKFYFSLQKMSGKLKVMNFRAVPINMAELSKQSLAWLSNTMKKKLFPFLNSKLQCEDQRENMDISCIASEHFRKPIHETLLKAFCVVPCLLIHCCLAKSFTPVSQALLLAWNSLPTYWPIRNIKGSDSCSKADRYFSCETSTAPGTC